jgi:hypothetical protein
MQLHEEYIVRHGLSVPIVRYEDVSRVMLKREDKFPKWFIFSVEWQQPDHHPGHFEKCEYFACHNGWSRREFQTHNRERIEFSDYEHYILDWAKEQKLNNVRVVTDKKERDLACWEMLLYIWDDWLAQNCSSSLYVTLEQTINPELNYRQRLDVINNIALPVSIIETYKYHLLPFVHHATWIENLIEHSVNA